MIFNPDDYSPREIAWTTQTLSHEFGMDMADAVALFNRYDGVYLLSFDDEGEKARLRIARHYLLGIVGRHEARKRGQSLLPPKDEAAA